VREERGDTLFFHYSRTYPALPWNPKTLLEGLEEEIEAAEEALVALEEEELGDFLEEWEESGALDRAREEGDTPTLRRYQAEFTDLMTEGSPTPLELYRQAFFTWVRASLWADLAFTIPVGERLCRESRTEPKRLVVETVNEVLEGAFLSEEEVLAMVLAEANIEPDSTFFPGLASLELDPWDEDWTEELEAQVREAVMDALRRECSLSASGLMELDRRLAWLNERYRIRNLEIRNQMHDFYLVMPGELVETNADTVADGRAQWGFTIRQLFEGKVEVQAVSRLVR
jgi:hypothetical protein